MSKAETPEFDIASTVVTFVTPEYEGEHPSVLGETLPIEVIEVAPEIVVTPAPAEKSVDTNWGILLPDSAPIPDPGSAQEIAKNIVLSNGWDETEYSCLYSLWMRESSWNYQALNKSSGAYGIPQSLPGEKMASTGADWATNPETQIRWGIEYIKGRYGSPCGAWAHSEANNWY